MYIIAGLTLQVPGLPVRPVCVQQGGHSCDAGTHLQVCALREEC